MDKNIFEFKIDKIVIPDNQNNSIFSSHLMDELNIPVICYGLRTDFQENFFEGSMWLMAWADSIEEVKTICWCGRKAICNARVVDGKVVKEGDQILLGGSSQYVSLCRKHFHEGKLGN